jgi:hypothetical protein
MQPWHFPGSLEESLAAAASDQSHREGAVEQQLRAANEWLVSWLPAALNERDWLWLNCQQRTKGWRSHLKQCQPRRQQAPARRRVLGSSSRERESSR